MKKINEANNVAIELAKSFGSNKVAKTGRNLGGGIDAIEFEEKPENWKSVGEKWQNLFFPKSCKENKAILEKINALPIVKKSELNEIVGFKAPQTVSSANGIGWVETVGLVVGKEDILLSITEGVKFEPNQDMKEILNSEFEQLQTKIEQEK